MTSFASLTSLLRPRPWEYRWRAAPLFLSQGVAVLVHTWWTGSTAMPTHGALSLVSVVLGFVGVGLRIWAVGLISSATMAAMSLSTDRLVTNGVYSLVRNPVYLGDLLLFTGYALFLSPGLGLAFAAFHVVRTLRLIGFEESQLAARHGEAYQRYLRTTPKLWVRLAAPTPGAVDWREGCAASAIWIGFAIGYVAVWLDGDVWAITPFETAGFLCAAVYFSRARRVTRGAVVSDRAL